LVPLAVGVSEFYFAKGSYESRRSRPDDRVDGWLVSSTKEPPTLFALDTYVRRTVSIISPFGGQKGDETTHSERFGYNK
jgi:hypothetical protein